MLNAKMSPTEAWEGFVGSQTPQEFVDAMKERGYIDFDAMTYAYANELPSMFPDWHADNRSADLGEIGELLAEYIRQSVDNA